jgi:hypothetical protein
LGFEAVSSRIGNTSGLRVSHPERMVMCRGAGLDPLAVRMRDSSSRGRIRRSLTYGRVLRLAYLDASEEAEPSLDEGKAEKHA